MIHDAQRIPLHESHPDLAERRVRDPFIAVLPDLGARKPCGPARQVSRVGSELVDLGWPAGDVDASFRTFRIVMYGLTSCHVVAPSSETQGLGPDANRHIKQATNARSPFGRQK